jgi:hypothetical protein
MSGRTDCLVPSGDEKIKKPSFRTDRALRPAAQPDSPGADMAERAQASALRFEADAVLRGQRKLA